MAEEETVDEISEELVAAAAEDDELALVLSMRAGEHENAIEVCEVPQEARALTEEELGALADLNEDEEAAE